MAQLVLGQLGARVGASLLPKGIGLLGMQASGAALGRALGSIAGAALDARFLDPPVEGPRLRDVHITEAREGASIPLVYGRMRVGGQLIWAARFKERREVTGGKGGPRVAEYSYTLSFAVALCQGEVSQVTRCWANGEPFDLSRANWRLHTGSETQEPDALIEAIEGDAPAYRGVAYVVFEDLPVDDFGARPPQMSFEVLRPLPGDGKLEALARGVNLIPGSGEFALATDVVYREISPGREITENAHASTSQSDFQVSLDQLAAELPNVTRVHLVVAWFGDDLRCGECRIRPGVEGGDRQTRPLAWSVAGVERGDAYIVSSYDGRPNYGGTPSDASVQQAIIALKARGYHVTLYPFVLMDIPDSNGLPNPYGGSNQPAFPWRGRITCDPAPDVAETTDGTAEAAAQVEAFFESENGYRAFMLHHAQLATSVGADGLLIGSEMIGLTRIRDAAGDYPAVEALRSLAAEVRGIVGADMEVSYAADWTEYGAHVRESGGYVRFPLDRLWASPDIDYVGLDWYPPMGDWRSGEDHADAAFGSEGERDYLIANVAGGEAYDWYYADADARAAQERSAITDGAYDEPWVFRQKDVRSWWSAAHHERTDGVRSETQTDWTPCMKPVRFVEFGCPAVDRGANQPNVFYDPKSSESALPHFSGGTRDDLIQRRAIEAFCAFWVDPANNPVSNAYAGRMTPADGIALWSWDARPYPVFPARDDVWSDSDNWRLGHWLTGRTGATLLADVVEEVCGLGALAPDVSRLDGVVQGYRFDGPGSVRAALEPLAAAYGFDCIEHDGRIAFRMRGGGVDMVVDPDELAESGESAGVDHVHDALDIEPPTVRLHYLDAGHASAVVLSDTDQGGVVIDVAAPVAFDLATAQRRANAVAEELARETRRLRIEGPARLSALEPGDIIALEGLAYRITEIADGETISVSASLAGPAPDIAVTTGAPPAPPVSVANVRPDVCVFEPPPLPGDEEDDRPLTVAWSEPWREPLMVTRADNTTTRLGALNSPGVIGRLASPLHAHVSGRWQTVDLWVRIGGGRLDSRSDQDVLAGANVALVETASGWEMLQFAQAQLVGEHEYRLSRLLRGQQGTEPEMGEGAEIGARIVFVTGREERLADPAWAPGGLLAWRAWRQSPDEASAVGGVVAHRGATERMWSPAHARASWEGGDLRLDWIRRARRGGDAWGPGEPPSEFAESYRITVRAEGAWVREWVVAQPWATYSRADREGDFPDGGAAEIAVAQIGGDGLPGAQAGVSLWLPAA